MTVTDVKIPSTVNVDGESYAVTSIKDNAFDGCVNLTDITIPNIQLHNGTIVAKINTEIQPWTFKCSKYQ